MKKLLAMLLSAVMVFSCSSVLAYEPTPENDATIGIIGGADGPTSVIVGEDETYRQALIDQAKALMPYKEGVNVWMNGSYMSFEDARPVLTGDRTFVPYRAILEGLGAVVSYDNGNIQAVFEDGSVMKLAIGSYEMTYQKGEDITTVTMDVAPYIDSATGRTYVPARFIGETLGLTVTWDPDIWVAYIIDWDELEADINSRFTEFNEMMAALMSAQDMDQAYRSKDSIKFTMDLDTMSGRPCEVTLEGESLMKGLNASGTYTLGLDLGGLKDGLEAMGQETEDLINAIDGADTDYIVSTEGMYFRGSLIALLTGSSEETWLGLPSLYDLYSQMGIDIEGIMNAAYGNSMNIGSLLRVMLEDGTLSSQMGYMAPDQAAMLYTMVYETVFGNDAIEIGQSGSKTVYTMSFDLESMMKSMQEGGMMTEEELNAALSELDGMVMDFVMKVTIAGEDIGCTLDMNMEYEGFKMVLDMTSDNLTSEGKFELSVEGAGEFALDFETKLTETDDEPAMVPTDGDIMDLEQLFSDMLGIYMTVR